MATIDSAAHWNDGAAGCRNQRAPRIGEIQRHKAVELERSSSGSTSSNSSTNSSTNRSPTSTTPTTSSSFVLRAAASSNSSTTHPTDGTGGAARREPSGEIETSCIVDGSTFSDPLLGIPEDGSSANVESRGSFSSNVETKQKGSRVSFDCEDTKLSSRQDLPATAVPNEANAQSQEDTKTTTMPAAAADPSIVGLLRNIQKKGAIPKMQSADSRSNSPRTPSSPGGSPLGSPRSNRRRTPLKESRRISIEQSGDAVQVNQYKLMEQIGKGAYGLVKLAYNKDDSTHYAMKMLSKSKLIKKAGLIGRGPKAKAPTMTPLQRVYKEIAVLKKLNHPNVVKLVEVLDDPAEDCLYLAFELEHQGEVLRIPTDRPLSEERTWSVFRDVLQGLEYLHYQRIIHSDMKPGNLLLGDDGHVKIADLGVCTEFLDDDATMDNKSPAGTPAFRAPETLLEGEHYYSGRAADIWSLGATLYALVFGNVPFIGLTVPAVYDKIKNETLKYPNFPAISDDLRDLITRMLIKDPSQRITLPQIKEHKWVTAHGKYPLPSEEDNCRLVELETEDLTTVCRSVPKLFDTFVLIKAMLKNHSFQNPFARTPSGRAPQRGGSRLERFVTAGRSKSAPGDYDVDSRHMSSEKILPVVTETVPSSNAESFEQSSEDPV